MKLSDYIVEFLIDKGITHVFGYPGGMIAHLIDSFDKYNQKIKLITNYHEQASSFAACGYAQYSCKLGVAYGTSGPGATNLITGIANAYFDSISTLFITGQVNTYEQKGKTNVRQKGFQEMDIISIVKPITKYAKMINEPKQIRYELEKAFFYAMNERKGPVVLDIPMDIFRAEINPTELLRYEKKIDDKIDYLKITSLLKNYLLKAKRPIIIAGRGISSSNKIDEFKQFVNKIKIPIVTSMIAIDLLPSDSPYKLGFIGTYGHRCANFAIAKSDLVISIGSRLDSRQTGVNLQKFAENAKLIRIDIDKNEFTNKIKKDEIQIVCNLENLIPILSDTIINVNCNKWLLTCEKLKNEFLELDQENANFIITRLSLLIGEDEIITTDVGQNQVWTAQSFQVKEKQRILFSGGHGAMGYSLPAAIGAYYAAQKPVISFNGDGGIQMNIQELQLIYREQIPIKVIIYNNHSLGMIRHFQEMYFDSNYVQTQEKKGYSVPELLKIAEAYKIKTINIKRLEDIDNLKSILINNDPVFINIELDNDTYVFPKLSVDRPVYDQDPLIDRRLFEKLLGKN